MAVLVARVGDAVYHGFEHLLFYLLHPVDFLVEMRFYLGTIAVYPRMVRRKQFGFYYFVVRETESPLEFFSEGSVLGTFGVVTLKAGVHFEEFLFDLVGRFFF